MKKETSIEALILKSTPFKENKLILQLFCKEMGPISAIVNTKKTAYLSSMMHIEGSVKKGRGDLFTLTEPHIINAYPNLREDFGRLQLANKIITSLQKTLVPARAVPALFILTKNTLKALTKESNEKALYSCFLLKLLLFEGLLPLHPEDMNKEFSEEEKDHYLTLATAKNFESLLELKMTASLVHTIENYTQETLPM
ncbi:DNA repair protein RecO [bacterium]|nr:DNA repair protein RecO [bacterium]